MAGWFGGRSCCDDRLDAVAFRGAGSLILQAKLPKTTLHSAFQSHRHQSNACTTNHSHQCQHQQPFCQDAVRRISSLPSLAARLPDHPPCCKRSRLVTNQRPDGFFILRRVADHGPIDTAAAVKDECEPMDCVWTFSLPDSSFADSLAAPVATIQSVCEDVASSNMVGRNTITREVLSC